MFTTVLQDLFSDSEGYKYNKSCNSSTVSLWLANSLACLQSNSVSQDKDTPFKHLQCASSQRKQIYVLNALELWQPEKLFWTLTGLLSFVRFCALKTQSVTHLSKLNIFKVRILETPLKTENEKDIQNQYCNLTCSTRPCLSRISKAIHLMWDVDQITGTQKVDDKHKWHHHRGL